MSEVERLEILAKQMFSGPAVVPMSYIDRMAVKLVEAKLKAISKSVAQ